MGLRLLLVSIADGVAPVVSRFQAEVYVGRSCWVKVLGHSGECWQDLSLTSASVLKCEVCRYIFSLGHHVQVGV